MYTRLGYGAQGYVAAGDKDPAVAVAPYPFALGWRVGGGWYDDGGVGGVPRYLDPAAHDDEMVDQAVIGRIGPGDERQGDGIALCEVDRYGAKVKSDFGIVDVAGLGQAEGERRGSVDACGMRTPNRAACYAVPHIVRNACAVVKRGQAAGREV